MMKASIIILLLTFSQPGELRSDFSIVKSFVQNSAFHIVEMTLTKPRNFIREIREHFGKSIFLLLNDANNLRVPLRETMVSHKPTLHFIDLCNSDAFNKTLNSYFMSTSAFKTDNVWLFKTNLEAEELLRAIPNAGIDSNVVTYDCMDEDEMKKSNVNLTEGYWIPVRNLHAAIIQIRYVRRTVLTE